MEMHDSAKGDGNLDPDLDQRARQAVHHLVEARADRSPDLVALKHRGRTMSAGELDARADAVAAGLAERGVAPGRAVAISVERSFELVVGLLGILKAGCHYVPVDPSYPASQRSFIIDDVEAPLILTHRPVAASWDADERPLLLLDDPAALPGSAGRPARAIDAGSLMYTIYTSGSTGRPKGVMVDHAGVCNRLRWMPPAYGLNESDVFLQKTPYNFDVSVWELFVPLIIGAALVIAEPGGHRDADYLISTINREQVTVVHFVPSMLRAFLADERASTCHSLRHVFCSGEALSRATQDSFFGALDAELHNLYGPTEASIEVLAWRCRRDDARPYVPIGQTIENMQAVVLDGDLTPVPSGETGELYLGGVGLAHGYARRPRLTAEAFVPNPFPSLATSRLYRTGDLVRVSDGELEFLGRRDHQVKVRGFRIELGEIEAALTAHPAVREAVVDVVPSGEEQQLVAHLLVAPGGDPTRSEIEGHLQMLVPAHMMPGRFIALDVFPVTLNGKLDRARLSQAPGARALLREVAGNGAESQFDGRDVELIRHVWGDVLGIAAPGLDDDFFELGGDSILSIQIVARLRREGLRTTSGRVLGGRTIRGLVEQGFECAEVTNHQGPVEGPAELTPIQRWFFDTPIADRNHWNMSLALELLAPVSPDTLRAALDALVNHHDQLRATFPGASVGAPTQVIGPPGAPMPIAHYDLARSTVAEQLETVTTITAEAQASLDLDAGPLVRAVYFALEPAQPDRLALMVHHLVMDGVSWRIVTEDLAALLRGQPLPGKTMSFRDWANRWQSLLASGSFAPDRAWWSRAPAVFDGALPEPPHRGFASPRRHTVHLGARATDQLLRSVPRVVGASVEEILVAALFLAVDEWRETGRLMLDLEGHGREPIDEVDVTRTVGWFTNIYPVAIDASALADRSMSGLLPLVRDRLREVPQRGIAYGMLRYGDVDQAVTQHLRSVPQPDVKLNYLGRLDLTPTGGIVRLLPRSLPSETGPAECPTHRLDVTAWVAGGELVIDWDFAEPDLDAPTIQDVASSMVASLERLIADSGTTADTEAPPVSRQNVGISAADLARVRELLAAGDRHR